MGIVSRVIDLVGRTTQEFKQVYASISISVKDNRFGAKGNGSANDTVAFANALTFLSQRGGGRLIVPPGTYKTDPIQIPGDNIEIWAESGSVKLIRTSTRGYALFGAVNSCKIQGLFIDCDKSPIEGAIRLAGSRNRISDCSAFSGDASSIVISGVVFNGAGATIPTTDNVVENCYVQGQKRYHGPGGTSPLIAGDMALRTLFRNCTVEDCAADVAMDYYDSDNAPGTVFENCRAIKNGAVGPATAFWSEGEQVGKTHTVKWINCYAKGFTNAFGSSEQVMPTLQNCKAENCTHAFVNSNGAFVPQIRGLVAVSCGAGLETTDTDAIISTTGGIDMEGVVTLLSLAKQSFVNYAGAGFTYDPVRIGAGCRFDKAVRVGYQGQGSRVVRLVDCELIGTQLVYYNAHQIDTQLIRVTFSRGSTIIGARIKLGSRIDDCRFIGVTESSGAPQNGTAITQQLDNFNWTLNNNYFENWQTPADINTQNIGKGNRTENCTNALPAANQ